MDPSAAAANGRQFYHWQQTMAGGVAAKQTAEPIVALPRQSSIRESSGRSGRSKKMLASGGAASGAKVSC